MNRGLKHLCIMFTCLSVVMFSSILVMADENDEDINLPVDVEQEFEIEESDEDEPFIIEENENNEEFEADEDIIIGEDEIIEVNKNEFNKNKRYIEKVVIDIIITKSVKRYRYYPDENGKYNIPKCHNQNVQYGSTIK